MTVESGKDLEGLQRVGAVVRLALEEMRDALEPGMTTLELDRIGAEVFERHGARSAPRMAYGFPGVNCISVNDEAVHGVPGERVIESGDLVKIDVTAELDGYIADAAETVIAPEASEEASALKVCAEFAFGRAVEVARAGRPASKIGHAIETVVKRRGFSVMPELSSHGAGRSIHEYPTIPNYYDRRLKAPLTEGLAVTIEPIISAGSPWTAVGSDGWTTSTEDGSLSAHHEHTVVITKGKPIFLTAA
ncbi:MAG: type I methionyl aminopeptidase [Rubrobacteraceae bacterium]